MLSFMAERIKLVVSRDNWSEPSHEVKIQDSIKIKSVVHVLYWYYVE